MLARWIGPAAAMEANHAGSAAPADHRADIEAEIADIFLSQAPTCVAALSEAVGAGQLEAVWRMAHRLGSEAGLVGARELADLCRWLEAEASVTESPPADLPARVAEIADAAERACEALAAERVIVAA